MISVVIPVYNRVEELRRALQSLAVQSVKNFEVLVCDDGSEEDIEAIVISFTQQLNIRYFKLEHSGGPAGPRRHGVMNASKEWISFLDSDDWWFPNRIEEVSACLSDEVDIIYHPLKIVYSSKYFKIFRQKSVGRSIEGDPLAFMMSWGNPIPNSAVTVRKSCLRPITIISTEKALASFEDFGTWISLAKAGASFRFIMRPLGCYWVGSDNISAMSERQIKRQKALFRRHCVNLPAELTNWAESYNNYIVGTYLFYIGRPREALAAFRNASKLRFRSQRLSRFIKMTLARIMMILPFNLRLTLR